MNDLEVTVLKSVEKYEVYLRSIHSRSSGFYLEGNMSFSARFGAGCVVVCGEVRGLS